MHLREVPAATGVGSLRFSKMVPFKITNEAAIQCLDAHVKVIHGNFNINLELIHQIIILIILLLL